MNEEDDDQATQRGFMIFQPEEKEVDQLSAMIAQFEQLYETAEMVSLATYLGNPDLSAVLQLAKTDPEVAWSKLDGLLKEQDVGVEFIVDVAAEERIRFVVEELMEEQVQNIRVNGLVSCFIYEDFHPNDAYDVQFWAETFLRALFQKNGQDLHLCLGRERLFLPDGTPASFDEIETMISRFWTDHPGQLHTEKLLILETEVAEDAATVKFGLVWYKVVMDRLEIQEVNGEAILHLVRSPYSGWDIVRFQIPGFDAGVG